MTRRRFYAPTDAFSSRRETVTLAEDEARYLREVLRLKPGAEVFVFDGDGKEFQCLVEESRRDSARLKVVTEVQATRPESPLGLTLAVALMKGEKFDLTVQKATELGVTQVVPVTTRFADIRLRDEHDAAKRVTRWQRIALEAAKQSGRARVPKIRQPEPFEAFIQESRPNVSRVMFSERDGHAIEKAGNDLPTKPSQMVALVGPEGGWADEEIALARDAGWTVVTIGGRTLRAETAAIAFVALLQHLFGDLK